jgi:hypothetical protein
MKGIFAATATALTRKTTKPPAGEARAAACNDDDAYTSLPDATSPSPHDRRLDIATTPIRSATICDRP